MDVSEKSRFEEVRVEVGDEDGDGGGGLKGEDGGVGLEGIKAGTAALEPELKKAQGFVVGRGLPDGGGGGREEELRERGVGQTEELRVLERCHILYHRRSQGDSQHCR